jgi:predicted ester cyclase
VRILATGTHTGDGLGIPPTGRPVRATGIIIMRWDDSGRIAEGWNEFDAAGMQRQLAAPAVPAVAMRAR